MYFGELSIATNTTYLTTNLIIKIFIKALCNNKTNIIDLKLFFLEAKIYFDFNQYNQYIEIKYRSSIVGVLIPSLRCPSSWWTFTYTSLSPLPKLLFYNYNPRNRTRAQKKEETVKIEGRSWTWYPVYNFLPRKKKLKRTRERKREERIHFQISRD